MVATVLVVLVLAWWLPGPRAALPPAPSPGASSGSPLIARSPAGPPNPKRTPGSINPNPTQANITTTICKSGWTATVRPPSAYTNALKAVQIVEYGYTDRNLSDYEEDHLVPLELGGAPRDPANLWPEPDVLALPDGATVGSDAKDHLENYLHRQVCTGALLLGDAQRDRRRLGCCMDRRRPPVTKTALWKRRVVRSTPSRAVRLV